jgi:hypothetical protein
VGFDVRGRKTLRGWAEVAREERDVLQMELWVLSETLRTYKPPACVVEAVLWKTICKIKRLHMQPRGLTRKVKLNSPKAPYATARLTGKRR